MKCWLLSWVVDSSGKVKCRQTWVASHQAEEGLVQGQDRRKRRREQGGPCWVQFDTSSDEE